jgi:serine/threonine protein kinase
VFVTSRGTCKLLTPLRCLPHEFVGGLFYIGHPFVPGLVHPYVEHRRPVPEEGPAADLYQLGVLLWRILVGGILAACRRPRQTFPPSWAAWQALEAGSVPPPSAFDPSVPPSLDAVVRRLLARDPAERFGSAREALAALSPVRAELSEPHGPRALAAVVAVLGADAERGGLSMAADGVDGTAAHVRLSYTETS